MRSTPPFLRVLPLVVLGILIGNAVEMEWWIGAAGAALSLLVALIIRRHRVAGIYVAAALVFGAISTTSLTAPKVATSHASIAADTLTVTSQPIRSAHNQRCEATLECDGTSRAILLTAPSSLPLLPGSRAIVRGRLSPLPASSYGNLMARRGFYASLRIDSPTDWHPLTPTTSPTIAARKVQSRLLGRIDSLHLPERESGVVKAMLLGWRGGIDPHLRDSYARAGASHILAISGLHVGLVAMLVWWLCGLLPAVGRRGHIIRNIIASAILLLYAVITGLSPSVVRATAMFCTAQMALTYGIGRHSLNTLCAAISLMLLFNPNNLFDISFLLSATAVAGIAIGYHPIHSRLTTKYHHPRFSELVGLTVVALCSTLATLPLVAYSFGVVSLVGLFINPVVIVCAEIVVLGGLIWISLPWDWLAPLAHSLLAGAAELQNRVVESAAQMSWSAITTHTPLWLVILCYTLVVGLLIVAHRTTKKREWTLEK